VQNWVSQWHRQGFSSGGKGGWGGHLSDKSDRNLVWTLFLLVFNRRLSHALKIFGKHMSNFEKIIFKTENQIQNIIFT